MQQEQEFQEQQLSNYLVDSNDHLCNCFDQESPNINHKISPITNLDHHQIEHDSPDHSHQIFALTAHYPASNNFSQVKQQNTQEKINNLFQPIQQQIIKCQASNSKNMSNRIIQHSLLDEVLEDFKLAKLKQAQPKNVLMSIKDLYKKQTREEKIQRYLKKKEKRIWMKKISYMCRKKVADKRVRINGRFVKSNQRCISHKPTSEIKVQIDSSQDNVKIEEDQYN